MNIRAYNTSLNVGAYSIYARVFLKKKKRKAMTKTCGQFKIRLSFSLKAKKARIIFFSIYFRFRPLLHQGPCHLFMFSKIVLLVTIKCQLVRQFA